MSCEISSSSRQESCEFCSHLRTFYQEVTMKLRKLNGLVLVGFLSLAGCATSLVDRATAPSSSNEIEHRAPAANSNSSSNSNSNSGNNSAGRPSNKKLGINRCMAKDNTSDIFSCLNDTYNDEDQKLNDVYSVLTNLLKAKEPARFDAVRTAQLAWIKLRDSDCKYDASADGPGEASGAAAQLCQIRQTQVRRADLEFKVGELKQHIQLTGE